MCVGKSTFKTSKLLPCDPTLQHRGKENVEFIRNKTKTKKQKVWKTANLKTFATLETRKQEKKERKKISVELHSFPPLPAVRFKSATCGFLLVQADSKYHFIMSSTFLPSSLSPRPSILSCVRDGRHRNSCVTVCAVWYSTAEYTVQ